MYILILIVMGSSGSSIASSSIEFSSYNNCAKAIQELRNQDGWHRVQVATCVKKCPNHKAARHERM